MAAGNEDEPVSLNRVFTTWFPEYGDEHDAIIDRQKRFFDRFKDEHGRPPTNREWDAWEHDVVYAPGRRQNEERARKETAKKALANAISKSFTKVTAADWRLIASEYGRSILALVAVVFGIAALGQSPELLTVLALLAVGLLVLWFAAAAWPLLLGLAALVYLFKNC
jgi:hypothetical protein